MEIVIAKVQDVVPFTSDMPLIGEAEETISEALQPAPGERLFALLDASIHDWVPESLNGLGKAACCLFDADPDIEAEGPWIVDLSAEPSLARNLMTTGDTPWEIWGKSGCAFFHSNQSLPELRSYLRRIVMIQRQDGSGQVFFRFWMTDILSNVLENATPDWPSPLRLFGPENKPPVISAWCLAGEKDQTLVEHVAPAHLPPGRLVFDDRLEKILRETMLDRFADELAQSCNQRFSPTLSGLAAQDQRPAFRKIISQGHRLGLTQRGPLVVWAEASLMFGTLALEDYSAYPLVSGAIEGSEDQMDAARRLNATLEQFVHRCHGPNYAFLFAALKRCDRLVANGPAETSALLKEAWPERLNILDAKSATAFVNQVDAQLRNLPEADAICQRTHALLCLFLGLGVREDPIHAWLAPGYADRMDRGLDSHLVRLAKRWVDAAIVRLEEIQ